jgi:hypothetical protein
MGIWIKRTVKMDENKIIYDLLNGLNIEQNIIFALNCINRTKHLPRLFINTEKYAMEYLDKIIPKDNIENTLNDIINKIYFNNIQSNEIDKTIELLEELLLDDEVENGTLKQLFSHYISLIIHTIQYIKGNESKYIRYCSDEVEEIVNQAKAAEYYTKNKGCTDGELNKYVKLMIKNELKKQIEIINIIKNGNRETLNEYTENNKTEYVT